ncbi:hypothetical protein PFISCL1PPCAC_12200, partial [Pristionchus fissidentatus]
AGAAEGGGGGGSGGRTTGGRSMEGVGGGEEMTFSLLSSSVSEVADLINPTTSRRSGDSSMRWISPCSNSLFSFVFSCERIDVREETRSPLFCSTAKRRRPPCSY